jgi:hypothetical protein
MVYYSEYDFLYVDIFKSGSTAIKTLFEYVLGREPDEPFFTKQPRTYITVVRNPYDRLVTQFYHANRIELWRDWKWTVHHPFFRKWVKETYENGYSGNDGHMFSQVRLLKYYENRLPYKIFKLEELVPYELFFFLPNYQERKEEINDKFLEIIANLEKITHHATNNLKQGIWQSYYDEKTIAICNEYFASDFIVFNYEMIEPVEFSKRFKKGLI